VPPPPSPFPRPLFAVAPPGLESVVQRELARLGIQARIVEGGVEWEGGWNDLVAAHLQLRSASRILVRIGSFRARALGELERKGAGLPWEALLPGEFPVRFRVSAGRSRIYHEGAAEERLSRVLEARGYHLVSGGDPEGSARGPFGDPLRNPHPDPGGPESPSPERPHLASPPSTVVVRIFRDEVTVSLDASGTHLHQRGYRLQPGSAPLRETLAAGALLALEWNGGTPFLDPFAGSGTLPIEAALLSMGVPPGLAAANREPRGFAFQAWPDFPSEGFALAVEAARRHILPAPAHPILASDRDEGALESLRRNAARAGVLEHLVVEHAALSRAPDPGPGGWIITNPPYGARLGERKRLRSLYRALGRRMGEAWAGRHLGLFVADPILERTLGLDLRDVFSTRNGGIRVRFLATR
jgi:putative N6-adenine-specific DNA methylase